MRNWEMSGMKSEREEDRNPEVYLERGKIFIKEGKVQTGISELEKAYKYSGNNGKYEKVLRYAKYYYNPNLLFSLIIEKYITGRWAFSSWLILGSILAVRGGFEEYNYIAPMNVVELSLIHTIIIFISDIVAYSFLVKNIKMEFSINEDDLEEFNYVKIKAIFVNGIIFFFVSLVAYTILKNLFHWYTGIVIILLTVEGIRGGMALDKQYFRDNGL